MVKKGMMIFFLLIGIQNLALAQQQIEIVFDASHSMNDPMGNQSKLQAAKQALVEVSDQIAPGTNVGLRVFGITPVKENVRESCFDSQMLVPIGPFEKNALVSRVMPFLAYGQTPLGYSLELAGKDFNPSPEVKRSIILISDGEESCGKDPVEVVKNLQAQGIDVKIHAIGFAVDEAAKAQLQQIAQVSGGTYKDAQNPAELKNSIVEVAKAENIASPSTPPSSAAQIAPSETASETTAEPIEEEKKELLLKVQRGGGENLISALSGAKIITSSNDDVAYAIDGNEETYASLDIGTWAVFSFRDNQPALIESFSLPIISDQGNNPKQMQLSGSLDSPETGFFPIATPVFKNKVDFKDVYQEYKINPPQVVRFLKITTGPSFEGSGSEHTEWKVMGKFVTDSEVAAARSALQNLDINLIAKESGGHIVAASGDSFEGLIDGSGEEPGNDEVAIDVNTEIIFGFADDKPAVIKKMAIPIFETSEGNCESFELSVSMDSPTGPFTPVGSFKATNMLVGGKVFQEFALPQPVQAKYVKVKLLSDFGGQEYCYTKELKIIGNRNLSAAQMPTPVQSPPGQEQLQPAASQTPSTESSSSEESIAETPSDSAAEESSPKDEKESPPQTNDVDYYGDYKTVQQ